MMGSGWSDGYTDMGAGNDGVVSLAAYRTWRMQGPGFEVGMERVRVCGRWCVCCFDNCVDEVRSVRAWGRCG